MKGHLTIPGRATRHGAAAARGGRGFTYIGILFAIVLLSASLGAAGTIWSVAARRSNEQELLFVGHEFRDAIRSYYEAGAAGAFVFPRNLSELLEDHRAPVTKRHLRRVYRDPMTRNTDWELIELADGAIVGIVSRSTEQPLKVAGFDDEDAAFEGANCYCEWRFVYLPGLVDAAGSAEAADLVNAADSGS